jgi:transposase
MMTQEEYVNGVLALKRQGKTITEIATELGYHPATISSWLRNGGPPPARTIESALAVVDERWAARIRELIQPPADKLLATSVFHIIAAEGFEGSYATVVRHLRELRGPRFRGGPAVSMPIETAPGEEALCGIPHRASYVEPANMRRRCGGGRIMAGQRRGVTGLCPHKRVGC